MLNKLWTCFAGNKSNGNSGGMVTGMPTPDSVLGELMCGRPTTEARADKTLRQLGKTINTFSKNGIRYHNQEFTDEAKHFSSFCARVVLENSCAALVGRLDPFRLLYLNEFQSQPTFEHGSPAKSGFRWQGDVMNPNKPLDQTRMWSGETELGKISRSLFSEHFDHLIWRPAFSDLLDSIQESGSDGFSEILSIEPEAFISRTKGRLGMLYSLLSKGVHWDFFDSAIEYDESTLKSSLQDLFSQISILGLTSHFIPTAYASLSTTDALETYTQARSHLS